MNFKATKKDQFSKKNLSPLAAPHTLSGSISFRSLADLPDAPFLAQESEGSRRDLHESLIKARSARGRTDGASVALRIETGAENESFAAHTPAKIAEILRNAENTC